MRGVFVLFMIAGFSGYSQQKKNNFPLHFIDSAAIRSWPANPSCIINSDGRYLSYSYVRSVNATPTSHTVVESVGHRWKKEFFNVDYLSCSFSRDGKSFIFLKGDSLCILPVGEDQYRFIAKTNQFQILPQNSPWLLYQVSGAQDRLVLYNMVSGAEKIFHHVKSYWLAPKENWMVLQIIPGPDTSSEQKLVAITLPNGETQTLWTGNDRSVSIENVQFDPQGDQLIFNQKKNQDNSIWYYKTGTETAIEKVSYKSSGVHEGYRIGNDARFTTDSKYIFFHLVQPANKYTKNPAMSAIDVYSYKDSILQFAQSVGREKKFMAVQAVEDTKVIQLEDDQERCCMNIKDNDKYSLITDNPKVSFGDNYWWPTAYKGRTWILSLQDGSRKQVNINLDRNLGVFLSPDSRYFIYIDKEHTGYFSYDISSNQSHRISGAVHAKQFLTNDNLNVRGRQELIASPAGWLSDCNSVLVDGDYDIWQLFFDGKTLPVNLTNGYGRRNHIKLRLVEEEMSNVYNAGAELLLTAFNEVNKYNGFYRIRLGKKRDPELFSMGPFTYYRVSSQNPAGEQSHNFSKGMFPVKAKDADVWIVQRETASSSPNYFITYDFKSFEQITDLHPEKEYNWLTAELVNYPQLDRTMSQGILYKPWDFDPKKKYPLIFNYYEQISYRMYEFPKPDFSGGDINIPWFVSRGYLVFTPDIHFVQATKSGKVTGEYAANSIMGAIKYFSARPYIDSKRIGIQGYSFGGYETYYLATHSKLFAAACAGAGVTDLISAGTEFNRTPPGRLGVPHNTEKGGQSSLGATLWQRPDLYIKASPIFYANQVNAPMLILANQGDDAVDFNQGAMMYNALRRLQKPCWMLQYDNGVHGVMGVDAIDVTMRMTQFFDHYLKGLPAPIWMTQGIPAKLKQVETGYEPDPGVWCSPGCKVCKKIREENTNSLKRSQ